MPEDSAGNSARLTGGYAAHKLKLDRQALFLDAVKAEPGARIDDLCARTGIARTTYHFWRRDDKDFAAQVDAFRASDEDLSWKGDFGSARKIFFKFDTFPHQMRLVQALDAEPKRQIIMCLLPPEHGKTTTIEDYICYALGKNPNLRIGIVSETIRHTRKIIRRLQKRMNPERQTAYSAKFGPMYMDGQERSGKPWSADYFTVWKSEHDERDYSVAGGGWTQHVYGSRFDLLIVDDIQSRRSIHRTEEMLEVFRQDILSRVGRKGKAVIIGTRVGMRDFYERLLDDDVVDELIRLPAINEKGEALCPELWPKEALMGPKYPEKIGGVRKQVQEAAWWTAYQQSPQVNQLATFTEDMIAASQDEERSIGPRAEFTILMLDPALGGGNALVAASFDTSSFKVLDCEEVFGLARTEEIFARVENFALRFHPQRLVIERDAMQKGFARDDRLRKLADRLGFEVVEHTTSRNKADEVLGVASMATSFVLREMSLPWKDEVTKARMRPLIKQLTDWRPNVPTKLLVQNLVMALWFGWKHWQETREGLLSAQKPITRHVPGFVRGWFTPKGDLVAHR